MKYSIKTAVAAGLALIAAALVVSGAAAPARRAIGAAAVNATRHLNANSEPGTWMSAGRTYDEQRYSPLTLINQSNVKNLSLAWYGDIDTTNAQE